MRIGIFGGSFDPVHLEHVHLAECAVRELSLDKLFVIPACVPPHKQGKRLAPEQDRLAACRLAACDGNREEDSRNNRLRPEKVPLKCFRTGVQLPPPPPFIITSRDN